MNLTNPLTRIFLAIALLVGLGGAAYYANAESIAKQEAQSLCTNLNLFRFDRSIGANYDTESRILGYEADLLQMGYICDGNGKLKTVTVINVTDDMNPTATDATCDADGKLVLPAVPNAKWQKLVDNTWSAIESGEGPGAYHVSLVADDGYALSTVIEEDVTVQPQLTGDACKVTPVDTTYQCRTNGLNGGPEYLAFAPDKLGPYNYGPAFTATTVADARKSYREQAWCDPVWMLQKYREYVSPGMTEEQADAKVHELIAQAKAGNNAPWDGMVNEILAAFDNAKHSFTTIPAGWYWSLVVLTNTPDGVPRIATVLVYRSEPTAVLRSVVTYEDGSTATLDLRTLCDLQLQTAKGNPQTGPAEAPRMAEIPRESEGTPAEPGPSRPEGGATPTAEPSAPPSATPSESASASPTPTPTPSETPTSPPVEICTWDDGSEHPLNPNGTCPKEPAPQPSGVESPVANPVASAAESSPAANETPLEPNTGTSDDTDDADSGTDGHTATETPVDEGGDGVVSDG